jgi:cytochrome c-type biogenesis protein CcmF
MVVHIGVVVIAVAFAASSAYVRQGEFRLEPGQTATMSGHEITFEGSEIFPWCGQDDLSVADLERCRDNRAERVARVRIDGGKVYEPAIASYPFASQTIGIPSVRSTLWDDVALSVLQFPEDEADAVVLRVTIQPLVAWLWIGGIIMALGTILAIAPGDRRRPTDPTSGRRDDPDRLRDAVGSASRA